LAPKTSMFALRINQQRQHDADLDDQALP
jgi:hypothetical protein